MMGFFIILGPCGEKECPSGTTPVEPFDTDFRVFGASIIWGWRTSTELFSALSPRKLTAFKIV
jgi:hypothetical protein